MSNETARDIAGPLTDEALADLIHNLGDILHARLHAKPRDDSSSWLIRQLDNANIEVRSWPTWRRIASRGVLGEAGRQ